MSRRAVRLAGTVAVRLIAITSIVAAWWGSAGSIVNADGGSGFHPPLPLPLRVLRGFAPPAHPWEPGNRGVDLAAHTGDPVYAAAAGVVVYADALAGRGVVSVTHGEVRTTYEPVDPVVSTGDRVKAGQVLGHVSAATDHCGPAGSCLHWGAIRAGIYVDPLAQLAQPRIRLLPIWSGDRPDSGTTVPVVVSPPEQVVTAVSQPAQLLAALGLVGKVIGVIAGWVMPVTQ